MSQKIKIDSVTGPSDGNDLKGCYFLDSGDGTFCFYDKNPNDENTPLQCEIADGSQFEFHLDGYPGILWSLHVHKITDERANGLWSFTNSEPGSGEAGGDGTFQAQAGGTGDPEDESAACASA